MTRDVTYFLVVVAVLVSAGAVVLLPGRGAPTAAPVAMELRPPEVPGWSAASGAPVEVLPPDGAARSHLFATYRREGSTLWLAVGSYPDEHDGQKPAAHDLLFPSHGWSDLSERHERIPLGDGGRSISANVLVMRTPERQLVVMYWYQIGELNVASDHWYRTRLLWNRVTAARADSALVRLASEVPARAGAEAVLETERQFVARLYPALLHQLSR